MKFNDKEIAFICNHPPVIEGRLNYRKTGGNLPHGYKEKWFKLIHNLLYYFDLNESGAVVSEVPTGVFVIENCNVQLEMYGETPFSFSITFQDELDRKLLLSGQSEEYINRWVKYIKSTGYETLRLKLVSLRTKLIQATGNDPLIMFNKEGYASFLMQPTITKVASSNVRQNLRKNSSFKSYVIPASTINSLVFETNHFGNGLEMIGSNVKSTQMTKKETVISSKSGTNNDRHENKDVVILRPPPPPPIRPQRTKPSSNSTNLIDL